MTRRWITAATTLTLTLALSLSGCATQSDPKQGCDELTKTLRDLNFVLKMLNGNRSDEALKAYGAEMVDAVDRIDAIDASPELQKLLSALTDEMKPIADDFSAGTRLSYPEHGPKMQVALAKAANFCAD